MQAAKRTVPEPAPTTLNTSQAWVRAAREGEATAFRSLHGHFGPMVRAIVLCRMPPAEADDVVQESFVQAWRKLDQLQEDGRFGPWIGTIARNLCAAQHRRRRPVALVETPPAQAAAGADPGAGIDAQRALEALRELPPAYAEPLALRLVEGWTGPEIAAHMGMTHGSVRVNLHRGLKLLRERLSTPAGRPVASTKGELA